jgi:hypothetical protein
MAQVHVVGLRELISGLRQASKEYPRQMKVIHQKVAEPVVRDAKSRVRSRSNRLASSIRSAPTQRAARLRAGRAGLDPRTGYDYSRINHYGGYPGAYRGNPFFTDAITANQERIIKIYLDETERFIDRVVTKGL